MVQINRSSVMQQARDILDIPASISNIKDTHTTIQPVVEIGPKFTTIARHVSSTTTGSSTIYTTPTDKDFYLTYAQLNITKDATSDNVNCNLLATLNAVRRILSINTQTTTAGSFNAANSFPYPIKIDRGTNITVNGTFTVGATTKEACIGGFILE
jgi:hypothetical protein